MAKDELAKLRGYVVSLQDRGSPYSPTSHTGLLALIDELALARKVVEAARSIFEYPEGNVPRAFLFDALAAYDKRSAHLEGTTAGDKAVGR